MSRIELSCIGSVSDGEAFGIPHPNKNEVVPYWISNASGANFHKIKVLGLQAKSLTAEGGTITVRIKAKDINDHSVVGKYGNDSSATDITIAELTLSLNNLDKVEYVTDWIMASSNITDEKLIYGEFSVVGELDVQQVYVWVDYENIS